MGGVGLNGHVLGGSGLNEFINVKALCLLENTTYISTDIYTRCHYCYYYWLNEFGTCSWFVCVRACACVFVRTVCGCVCISWWLCVSEYLFLCICIYNMGSTEVMNLSAVSIGLRTRRLEL